MTGQHVAHIEFLNFLSLACALAALSFWICVALILLDSRLPWFRRRTNDLSAGQSMHTHRTPRVGGIAVFCALGLGVMLAPLSIALAYAEFILATSLIFVVGLSEDLGFRVSPRGRLLAMAGSSLLVIWFLGVWIPRAVGVPEIDGLLQYWAVGIPLTLLLTAGISNGFNLIDGVNGLAALVAIAAAVALSEIAGLAGYPIMVDLALMFAAGIVGFALLNYPFGLIFLGDAGAYTIGFVLSWFGIAILLNAPDVSPWAILLTMYWPVVDTLLAMYRRYRGNRDVSQPDRLHVHQMVMRALEICVLGRNRRHIANPLTTLVLAPFVLAPPIAGVLLWNQNLNAFLAVLGFGVLFFSSYAAIPGLIRRFRIQWPTGPDLPR